MHILFAVDSGRNSDLGLATISRVFVDATQITVMISPLRLTKRHHMRILIARDWLFLLALLFTSACISNAAHCQIEYTFFSDDGAALAVVEFDSLPAVEDNVVGLSFTAEGENRIGYPQGFYQGNFDYSVGNIVPDGMGGLTGTNFPNDTGEIGDNFNAPQNFFSSTPTCNFYFLVNSTFDGQTGDFFIVVPEPPKDPKDKLDKGVVVFGEFRSNEPHIIFGDVNLDGTVNLLDVSPFVELLTSTVFQKEADINQDGVVNLLDVAPFVDILTGP